MTYGLVNGHLADDVTQRCCEAVRPAILATAWLLVLFCLYLYKQESQLSPLQSATDQ